LKLPKAAIIGGLKSTLVVPDPVVVPVFVELPLFVVVLLMFVSCELLPTLVFVEVLLPLVVEVPLLLVSVFEVLVVDPFDVPVPVVLAVPVPLESEVLVPLVVLALVPLVMAVFVPVPFVFVVDAFSPKVDVLVDELLTEFVLVLLNAPVVVVEPLLPTWELVALLELDRSNTLKVFLILVTGLDSVMPCNENIALARPPIILPAP